MRISDWSSDVCSSDLRLALSSLSAFWTRVDPVSLGVVQGVMQAWLPAAVWDPGMTTLLAWPAVLVLGALGILLLAICRRRPPRRRRFGALARSEEHTSELQSLMRISYAVFCLKKHTRTITI